MQILPYSASLDYVRVFRRKSIPSVWRELVQFANSRQYNTADPMKRNQTQLITALGWQVHTTVRGEVTKVILSDGETVIPYCHTLHKDLEAFAEREKGEGSVQSFGGRAA